MTATAELERRTKIGEYFQAHHDAISSDRLARLRDVLNSGVPMSTPELAEHLGMETSSLTRWAIKKGVRHLTMHITGVYPPEVAVQQRLEDILWMMRGQVNEVDVAQRLGIQVAALENWCYRNGHVEDVWEPLTAYRRRTTDDWKGDRSLLRAPRDGQTIGRSRQMGRGRNPIHRGKAA